MIETDINGNRLDMDDAPYFVSREENSNDLKEKREFEKIKLKNFELQHKNTTQTSSSKSSYQMPGPKLKLTTGTYNELKINSSDEPMQKESSDNIDSDQSYPLRDREKNKVPSVVIDDYTENIGDRDLQEYNNNDLLLSNASLGKHNQITVPKFFKGGANGHNSHVPNSIVRHNDETVIRAMEKDKPAEKHTSGISDNSISSGKAKKKTETPESSKEKESKKELNA